MRTYAPWTGPFVITTGHKTDSKWWAAVGFYNPVAAYRFYKTQIEKGCFTTVNFNIRWHPWVVATPLFRTVDPT